MKYLILLSLLITNFAWAQDSVILIQGQPAPFPGYLLPVSKILELRNTTFERDALKSENTNLQKALDLSTQNSTLQSQQVQLLAIQNVNLAKANTEAKTMNSLEKGLWFAGGIIISGLAVWGAHEVVK